MKPSVASLSMCFCSCAVLLHATELKDISTALMRSTYKIEGPGAVGTGFVLGAPVPDRTNELQFVLVTANHVLEKISASNAMLHVRVNRGGELERQTIQFMIRHEGRPMWVKHQDADVAAMMIALPKDVDIDLLPLFFLADDDFYTAAKIEPGDRLCALGFPFGAESHTVGFPILRTGAIASYPLIPTKKHKVFLLDLEIRQGNSGGPVFFLERDRIVDPNNLGRMSMCNIMGLVTEERAITEQVRSLYETRQAIHPINVAVVVHASLIRETIAALLVHEGAKTQPSGSPNVGPATPVDSSEGTGGGRHR